MTRRSVTDEDYGQLGRRLIEVARRTDEGTLPFGRVMDALQAIIEGRFNVRKTIKLGTGLKSADDFRQALKDAGFRISDWVNDILGNPAFVVVAEETEIDLVVVSVKELGFKDRARLGQIYDRAKERGLELCPAEVGPQLRLQYRDQPMGERLLIGTESIGWSDGYLGVFRVEHDSDGLWLLGHRGWSDNLWDLETQWVFVRPRK